MSMGDLDAGSLDTGAIASGHVVIQKITQSYHTSSLNLQFMLAYIH